MQVKEFIDTTCACGGRETKISDIFNAWMSSDINLFVVLDEEKKVVGVVTLTDIFRIVVPDFLQGNNTLAEFATDRLLDKNALKEVMEKTAGEIMNDKPVTVTEDDYFMEAASKMFSLNFKSLPVLDHTTEKYLGVVTRLSIENAFLDLVTK